MTPPQSTITIDFKQMQIKPNRREFAGSEKQAIEIETL